MATSSWSMRSVSQLHSDSEMAGSATTADTDAAAIPVDVQTLEQRRARMATVRDLVDGASTVLGDPRRYLQQEDDFAEINPDTYQPLSVPAARARAVPAGRAERQQAHPPGSHRLRGSPLRGRPRWCTSSPSTTGY